MNRRIIVSMMCLGALGGCMNTDYAPETGGVRPHYGKSFGPPAVPGVEGPYGTPIPMAAPYTSAPPGSMAAAQRMMSANMPMNSVQMNPMGMPMGGPPGSMMPPPMAPGNMMLSPPGVPPMPGMTPGGFGPGGPGMPPGGFGPGGPGGFGPGGPGGFGPGGPGMPPGGFGPGGPGMPMPPMGSLQKAGFTSGNADSGMLNADMRSSAPGGLTQAFLPGGGAGNGDSPAQRISGGIMPAQFSNSSPVGSMFPAQRTQVYFSSPVRMKVYWFTQGADGKPNYSTTPLETPGRYNFAQGAIYRLKLTNIPGRPALELYPTLEVVPTSPRTNEFLAHNSVPIDFSEEDFKQVVDRNYIVKVIYLPDPQNQDGAGAGPGEISSTQLQPGQDPIQEALRLGSILLVLRIGNIDQGVQHTPPMTAPVPGGPPLMMKPPGQGVMPFNQVPFNFPPITPGMMPPPNMVPPNQLPPLNVAPKDGKVEILPNPKKDPNGKLDLPPLPPPPGNGKAGEEIKLPGKGAIPFPPLDGSIPPGPGVAPEKQNVPPIPVPGTEGSSILNPKTNPPVVPASSSKETSPTVPPVTLPALPMVVDPLSPDQPLPIIPMVPEKK